MQLVVVSVLTNKSEKSQIHRPKSFLLHSLYCTALPTVFFWVLHTEKSFDFPVRQKKETTEEVVP